MSQQRAYDDYLIDILTAIEKVEQFIEGMTFDEFERDEKTVFAVIRALEIVGEATKRLPDSLRKQYPDVPWREMAGMRDKLIHDYIGIKMIVVWKTVREDLPTIEPEIRRIIEEIV